MNAISQNHSDFAARIARIETGAASSTQLLYVGADEVYKVPLRVRKVQQSGGAALFQKIGALFEMGFALILGAASHGAGQIVNFIIHGVVPPHANPDMDMLLQFVTGFLVATILGQMAGLRWKSRVLCKAIGVGCGLVLFHNAVHQFPSLFEAVTSPAWVDQILAHTQAQSVLWRGASIAL
jgi:hypothetical protein